MYGLKLLLAYIGVGAVLAVIHQPLKSKELKYEYALQRVEGVSSLKDFYRMDRTRKQLSFLTFSIEALGFLDLAFWLFLMFIPCEEAKKAAKRDYDNDRGIFSILQRDTKFDLRVQRSDVPHLYCHHHIDHPAALAQYFSDFIVSTDSHLLKYHQSNDSLMFFFAFYYIFTVNRKSSSFMDSFMEEFRRFFVGIIPFHIEDMEDWLSQANQRYHMLREDLLSVKKLDNLDTVAFLSLCVQDHLHAEPQMKEKLYTLAIEYGVGKTAIQQYYDSIHD